MKVTFFSNGNTLVVDDDRQVPALQEPWILLFAEFLLAHDVDPTTVEFQLPMGQTAQIVKVEDGYNWEVRT